MSRIIHFMTRYMKINLIFQLIIVLLVFGKSNAAAENPSVKIFFGPKAYADSTGLLYNFLQYLDSAEKQIYGSVHEMDLVIVAQKLVQKANDGVDVQLVIESRWLDVAKNSAAVDVLMKSPVKIYPDNRKSGLMHNKFFIVDGFKVWTGSTNMTENGFLFNFNNNVWIEDEKIARNFLTEFEEQREGKFGKTGSGKPNTPFVKTYVDSTLIETYFSPEDKPIEPILRLINQAKSSIEVLCFVFSSREIAEALTKAHRRGVKVTVLLDDSFGSLRATENWRFVPFDYLKLTGADCRYDREKAKLHHKVMIVDHEIVLTGSLNLSKNGAQNNDENILIIHDPTIANAYYSEFLRLWNLAEFKKADQINVIDDDAPDEGEEQPGEQ